MSGREILLTALIGGSPAPTNAGDRVRYDEADENDVQPFVVCRRISVDRALGMDNTILAIKETFHVECWGETRAESEDLEIQVVDALFAANLPPSNNEADGLDPIVYARAAVVVVEIWTTPEVLSVTTIE